MAAEHGEAARANLQAWLVESKAAHALACESRDQIRADMAAAAELDTPYPDRQAAQAELDLLYAEMDRKCTELQEVIDTAQRMLAYFA